MTLLLRSTLCLLAFVALYHAAMPSFPSDHQDGRAAGLALADRNRARAREYLESKGRPVVVLVGSSITGVIRGLPENWHNLTQDGGTPLTGLQIVARHSPKPQWVFIETNRVQYAADAELVRELFDPRRKALLEQFPAFRERNRPSHIAMLLSKAARDRWSRSRGKAPSDGAFSLPASAKGPNRDVLRANLNLLADEVPAAQLDARIEEFQSLIAALRLAGTRVAFIEVPEHPNAYATPLKRQLVRRMAQAFPASRYPWAPKGEPRHFATTDGIHLDAPSGRRFARKLSEWAIALPSRNVIRDGPRDDAIASRATR